MPDSKVAKSTLKDYECIDFTLNGYEGTLIVPLKPTNDKRWIWRTEFLGAFDGADIAMIEQGWHLAYYKISDMYGSPRAVELMKCFQEYIVEQFGLYAKMVLFGISRGGLYAFNYAAEYSETVDSQDMAMLWERLDRCIRFVRGRCTKLRPFSSSVKPNC